MDFKTISQKIKGNYLFLYSFFIFFNSTPFSTFSQSTDTTGTDDSTKVVVKNMKGFHLGLQTGTLFANKYTSNLYDGYGLDPNGNKNNFTNSFLNQMLYAYGGYGGTQTDRIAQALNIAPNTWSFTPSDMPTKLKYNVAIQIGLNTRYCFDNKNSVILNLNASKLTVSGDFIIETTTPTNTGTGLQSTTFNTFIIMGGEERLTTQLGFQHIFGDTPLLNFFLEGGLDMIMTKYLKNQATINNLTVDLSSPYFTSSSIYYQPLSPYNQSAYGTFRYHNLEGVGFGIFAGIGFNLTLSTKYVIQLVYNPSYDKINIGASPKLTFQQSIGFRAYYNF